MAARSGSRRPPAPNARTGESSGAARGSPGKVPGAPRVLAQTSRNLLERQGRRGSAARFSPRRKGESIKTPEQLPRRVGAAKLAGVFVLYRYQKMPSSSGVFPLGGGEARQKSPPLKKGTPAGGSGEQGSGSGQGRDRSASHAARFPSAVSSPDARNPSRSSASPASRRVLGSGSNWRSVPRYAAATGKGNAERSNSSARAYPRAGSSGGREQP